MELGNYRPTDAAELVFQELKGKIEAQLEIFHKLVAEELAEFNRKLKASPAGLMLA